MLCLLAAPPDTLSAPVGGASSQHVPQPRGQAHPILWTLRIPGLPSIPDVACHWLCSREPKRVYLFSIVTPWALPSAPGLFRRAVALVGHQPALLLKNATYKTQDETPTHQRLRPPGTPKGWEERPHLWSWWGARARTQRWKRSILLWQPNLTNIPAYTHLLWVFSCDSDPKAKFILLIIYTPPYSIYNIKKYNFLKAWHKATRIAIEKQNFRAKKKKYM